MVNGFRLILGLSIWSGLALWAWSGWGRELSSPQGTNPPVATQIWQYARETPHTYTARFPQETFVGIGDPIFVQQPDGQFELVGQVQQLLAAGDDSTARITGRRQWVRRCRLTLFGNAPEWAASGSVSYHTTPDDMAWVMQTMLPTAKRVEVAGVIREAMVEHQRAVTAELQPIILDAVRDVFVVLEKELQSAYRRHYDEVRKVSNRYQKELVDKQIVPLVKEEVWPIVLKHGQPVAEKIGLEIWERVSVWRFGWRYVADLAPLTRKNRFENEFQRFLRDEAIPELNEHTDDLIDLVQDILRETISNRRVQEAIRDNVFQVLEDRELQRLFWGVVQETLTTNTELRAVLQKHWYSKRTQQAIHRAASRLDPSVQRIGELLLGSPEAGITPEFNEVLRNRILFKDRRWFVLRRPTSETETDPAQARAADTFEIVISNQWSPSPFLSGGTPDD